MTDAARFAGRAVGASLGLFGLLRLGWVEAHVLVPVTRVQGAVAVNVFGTSTVPVEVTLACSGADAMALCVAAVLAYPVRWRARVAGACGGLALILVLNMVRIGTLGHAAASPALFDALHLYVWPALLTLAIAAYVFAWIGRVEGPRAAAELPPPSAAAGAAGTAWRRFAVLTAAFLVLFAAASPFYLESAAVLAIGAFTARAAAGILGVAAVEAHATGNILWTVRGGFSVTQECISTPLIPVYLAAVTAYSATWRQLAPRILAVFPLFVGLGVVRLLIVALPQGMPSPVFFVHAFYQLLLATVLVAVAAVWRHGRRVAPRYAMAGLALGTAFVLVLGPLYARVFAYQGADPQGAFALLPVFQAGLYLALCTAAFLAAGWPRLVTGFVLLAGTQAAALLVLHALATHAGWMAHTRDARGWAVAGPVVILAAVLNAGRARR